MAEGVGLLNVAGAAGAEKLRREAARDLSEEITRRNRARSPGLYTIEGGAEKQQTGSWDATVRAA